MGPYTDEWKITKQDIKRLGIADLVEKVQEEVMSEEEKKAIEHLRCYPKNWMFYEVDKSSIDIVLNLI